MSASERDKAVRQARSLVSANPANGLFLVELANRLRLDDQLGEALSWLRWGVRSQAWPEHQVDGRAWHLMAHLLMDVGRYAEAELIYQRADLDPHVTSPRLQHDCARARLGQGDWPAAWAQSERRWELEAVKKVNPSAPFWLGWPNVKSLSIWDEQGFGDTLQALRWLPNVMAQGLTVTLEVRLPLVRLCREGLRWLGPGLDVRARHERESSENCHGSLLSLPFLLNSSHWPDPEVLRLSPPVRRSGRPRVALVWESGRYLDDPVLALEFRRKTMPKEHWQALCTAIKKRGIDLVLLQQGFDLASDADFYDQALVLQHCDLLLSVDTAAAHLGGSLGHPTWMLLPWAAASRWQRNTAATELYPGMRLIRQPRHGDWSGLLARVETALDDWLATLEK